MSTPSEWWNPGPPYVLLGRRWPASQRQEMQSTVNYLWHTDDLLGQGATASVYKARNKVGHRPGCQGAPYALELICPVSPGQHPGWCAWLPRGLWT